MTRDADYNGFEVGPIRPPSEARSLLLRVTRNCPWNRCTFCGLYKGERFSIRPVAHVRQDIDRIRHFIDAIRELSQRDLESPHRSLADMASGRPQGDRLALHAAQSWMQGGMRSVFLQDANTLVLRPDDLVAILDHLRSTFPQIERVTSYARSQTVARIGDGDLARIAAAGLNRIHIGLESGCDAVLDAVRKGADQETHVLAGRKVKRAGIELSEYYMPGLGGSDHARDNALQTAAALNRIDPDFIRIRSLALPESLELAAAARAGDFEQLDDVQVAEELLLFLEHLDGIGSTVVSDHILNLLPEVEGRLPDEKERMTAPLRSFLALPGDEQLLYRVGRRAGVFSRLADLKDPDLRGHAENIRSTYRVTPESIDAFTREMMSRFI